MIALEKIMREEIETERLLLRDVVDSDRQSIFQLYSDKASSLLDDWEPMEHEDEAELKIREIRREFTEREGITFIIEKKDTKEFIGCCGIFEFDEGNSNCCVFYQVDKRKRNHGFATEAMRVITRYGIKELKLHTQRSLILKAKKRFGVLGLKIILRKVEKHQQSQ